MLRLITCSLSQSWWLGAGTAQDHPRRGRRSVGDSAALQQWPRDFNAKDLAVCALFEDDVVVAYPGGPDNGSTGVLPKDATPVQRS